MAGGGGLNVRVTIDADRATAEFREARRDVNARTREGLRRAGERVALPAARRYAGGLKVAGQSVATSLMIRPTTRDAFLTTRMRGIKARAVGLQEHGGVVTTQIRPKGDGQAVVVNGQPVAYVATPRRHTGRKFMTRAVERNRDEIAVVVRDELMHAFDGLDWE